MLKIYSGQSSSYYFAIMNLFLLRLLLPAFLMLLILEKAQAQSATISLAKDNAALVDIVLPDHPSETQQLAAQELSSYLSKISDAKFSISSRSIRPSIRIVNKDFTNKETYHIEIKDKDIILSSGSDRATLYAVYDFLERLGCKWLAPDFEFYHSNAELIPHQKQLNFELENAVTETPALEYRKLDVSGSRTLTADKLKRLVEWMPKVRYNTLRFKFDRWERFRLAVTPHLKKRDIFIEVGGHGYQHFLNDDMENKTLFKQHPNWFGKDSTCNPSPSKRLVFNTENPEALSYFTGNVIKYLKDRPEIDIFDCWPPDVGRWQDCPHFKKYGTPQERQVKLSNHVYQAIKDVLPNMKMEIIAYSYALFPPEKTALNKDILLEICPINQSFEKQIYDPSKPTNQEYVQAIKEWRAEFNGSITLYSYYRKQAWRSAPVIIPNYMQQDMQWFSKVPLQGIACYAESNDWYTYELNHYILGKLAWDPYINVDSLCNTFFKGRYGDEYRTAASSYELLEKTVRVYGSIPFSTLKSKEQIKKVQQSVKIQKAAISKSKMANKNKSFDQNFARLLLMYEYFKRDLEIQYLIAADAPEDELFEQIRDLVTFLQQNIDEGVFILTGSDDFGRFTKKYGLTNQSLLD